MGRDHLHFRPRRLRGTVPRRCHLGQIPPAGYHRDSGNLPADSRISSLFGGPPRRCRPAEPHLSIERKRFGIHHALKARSLPALHHEPTPLNNLSLLDHPGHETLTMEPPPTDLTGDGFDVPRLLGELEGEAPGPTLIIVGGLHGNEPAGILGLQAFFRRAQETGLTLPRGRMVGLAGNRRALQVRQRFLSDDLNRHWVPERVEALRQSDAPLEQEDAELRELDATLQEVQKRASPGFPIYLLDIHTTSGTGGAFATLEDSLPNRRFAFAIPVPVILGLEEELSGTLTSYWSDQGLVTCGFEAGQHDEPEAEERAHTAIWITLAAAQIVPEDRPEVVAAEKRLAKEHAHLPHVLEVLYRHHITPEDQFRMDLGYINFQPIDRGQALAQDRSGVVRNPLRGRILMPLYQTLGADGFFVVRKVHPMWLELSSLLRRRNIERYVHLLPGVRRHPETKGVFIADRRYARFLALEVFHLLGFRRIGDAKGRYLIMARRPDDPEPRLPNESDL